MQRECYERSVFRIYVGAQPPTLHPSAYRYHALVHECEPRKDGVQVIQQFVLVQFRQGSDSFFMLKKLHYYEAGREKDVFRVRQDGFTKSRFMLEKGGE